MAQANFKTELTARKKVLKSMLKKHRVYANRLSGTSEARMNASLLTIELQTRIKEVEFLILRHNLINTVLK